MPRTSRPGATEEAAAGFVVHALVPAAGRGERFGGDRPKQFLEVGGIPLVTWTIERLIEAGCASVTVAVPASDLAWADERLRSPEASSKGCSLRIVAGADSRQGSVSAALASCPASADELVAVHDGARPAVDPADFLSTVSVAARHGCAVLGRAVSDTVKRIEEGRIAETLDRRGLFRAETPQVFRRSVLEQALEAAARDAFEGTDEASLVERLGGVEIVAVEARRPNPKVTVAEDLALVSRILSSEEWG